MAVLHPVADVCNVSQAHWRAIPICDHDRLVLFAGNQLVVGADRERLPRAVERALRLIHIRQSKRGAYIFQTEPVRSECSGIRLNPHRGFLAAAD